jgi:hypothetical protein
MEYRFAGHKGLAMTKRKAHTDMDRLRQAVRLLSRKELTPQLTPGERHIGNACAAAPQLVNE